MKTHGEYMAEENAKNAARELADRAGRQRFIQLAQAHVFPSRLQVNQESIRIVMTMIEGGTGFPTLLACDHCSFPLIWSADQGPHVPQRFVGCAACGFVSIVPRTAQIGTTWPAPPAEGASDARH